jgi:predicted RNase H-like HicB family nuclease
MMYSDFEKQYKSYEQAVERLKEVNEFWINAIISSLKQFTKAK